MTGKHGSINPATNDNASAKTNMLNMWKESLARTKRELESAVKTAKSEHEARADLEQRVRNGQLPCRTCARRTYRDESDDGGVSFQAGRHIPASTAGVAVTAHEHEHVAAGKAESKPHEENGVVKNSTVAFEYAKCPECGRTYVKGGITKTTTRPATYRGLPGLDAKA